MSNDLSTHLPFYHQFAKEFGALIVLPERNIREKTSLRHWYRFLVQDTEHLLNVSTLDDAKLTFNEIKVDMSMIIDTLPNCPNREDLLGLIDELNISLALLDY